MNDPLLNYIAENREELDNQLPADKNWEAIQNRMEKPRKIKKIIAYSTSIAAVFVVGLILLNQNKVKEENELAELLTTSDFEISQDSIGIIRTDDVDWENAQQVIYTESNSNQQKIKNGWAEGTYFGMVSSSNGCLSDALGDKATGNQFHSYSWSSDNSTEEKQDLDLGYFNTYAVEQKQQAIQYDVDRYYEQYDPFTENEFETPLEQPLSTFGIDVDGAGYSNMRRFIQAGYLPPKDAVKLEEMVNYFNYDLPAPTDQHPFSITTEVGECPWEKDHLLMQVALKGKEIEMDENQSNNLVFLIDVSGSMNDADKLPLLKKSLYLLVNEMGRDDRVAIVVYAGAAGLVLPSTSGAQKSKIYDAIEKLSAGGSTAGGSGIQLAYQVANDARIKGGNNRIILATDGDFNVGVSGDDELVKLIEEKRKTGISLSVLGFGTGNLQNSKMEKLADNGNGNYNYIDNILEAKKVLVDEMGGTLITIAKDVKLQLEFNPEHVKNYRLLGYENRVLQARDFDDDTKDAGDLGSGHTIVVLYEIEPTEALKVQTASNLRYQKQLVNTSKGLKDELAVIKFRYKKTNANTSQLIEKIVLNKKEVHTTQNFNFASAVAEFGLLIRASKYKGSASFKAILERAKANKGIDTFGYRAEFIQLVERAKILMQEYELKQLAD